MSDPVQAIKALQRRATADGILSRSLGRPVNASNQVTKRQVHATLCRHMPELVEGMAILARHGHRVTAVAVESPDGVEWWHE